MNSMQVKVTLPAPLYDYVRTKAQRFGLTMSAYLKYLIFEDAKDTAIPEFTMSPTTEKVAIDALKQFRSGKTKRVRSLDKFINSL